MSTEQKPSIGRVVHYVSYGTPGGEYKGEHLAAIITAVHNENCVSLAVLNPTGLFFASSVYQGDLDKGGTWHWPERL